MVDTVRTLAALQTLFANNTSGDISPQDLRDFLVSAVLQDVNGVLTLAGSQTGAGDGPVGAINMAPTFAPAGNISIAYGSIFIASFNPAAARTIGTGIVAFFRSNYGNVAGAVTQGQTLYVSPPLIGGSLKPGAQYGIFIGNQGAAGITTAAALGLTKPTGATTNAYLSFDVADATAAGSYFGRIPVLYAGAVKYIHIFNA